MIAEKISGWFLKVFSANSFSSTKEPVFGEEARKAYLLLKMDPGTCTGIRVSSPGSQKIRTILILKLHNLFPVLFDVFGSITSVHD